jgi:hypothetical protein
MKLRLFGSGLVMAAGLSAAALSMPAASYATSCYTGCSTTAPKSAGGTPTSDGSAADASSTHVAAQDLAFTGANVMLPASIGGGAVLIGGGLVLAGRRRRFRTSES